MQSYYFSPIINISLCIAISLNSYFSAYPHVFLSLGMAIFHRYFSAYQSHCIEYEAISLRMYIFLCISLSHNTVPISFSQYSTYLFLTIQYLSLSHNTVPISFSQYSIYLAISPSTLFKHNLHDIGPSTLLEKFANVQ